MKPTTLIWIAGAHLVAIAVLPAVFSFWAFLTLFITVGVIGIKSL